MNRSKCQLMVFCLLGLFLFTMGTALQAVNQLVLPMHQLEIQKALNTKDLNLLQASFSPDRQSRDGYRMTLKNIDHYYNGSTWGPYEKHLYTYNTVWMDQTQDETIQRYSNSNWTNYQRYVTTYTDSGDESTFAQQQWQNGQWADYRLTTYQYNTSGQVATYLTQSWVSGAWQNYNQSMYTYDESGNIASITMQNWQVGNWVDAYQYALQYNENGDMSVQIISTWGGIEWMPAYQMLYTYSGENITLYMFQVWSSTDNQFNDYSRTTFTYIDDLLTQDLFEAWQNGSWHNMILQTHTYDTNGNETETIKQNYGTTWVNTERSTMEYEYWGVANDDNNVSVMPFTARIMPNPTHDNASVLLKTETEGLFSIGVYNTRGEKLSTASIQAAARTESVLKLDTAALPSGIYLVQIRNHNKQIQTMKLMKY